MFSTDGALQTRFRPPHAVNLARTFRPLRRGSSDSTTRIDASGVWRTLRTETGPATLRMVSQGGDIVATAWGDGAADALARAPGLAGCLDEPGRFAPANSYLARLVRRQAGLCLTRTGTVLDLLLASILEQKVPGAQARSVWRAIVSHFGEPAPGPTNLLLAPAPERLAAAGYHEFHPLGLERRRAEVIREVCRRATRIEEAASMTPVLARRRLQAFPGVGAWTAAEVTRLAHGDPDAISVGDYHVPNLVTWALAGEPRGNDARMLELLEPYAGQRGRVVLLLEGSGLSAPRYGPRLPLIDISRL